MAGVGPEHGQIRDPDEARIFADAEIPNRDDGYRSRIMARAIRQFHGDHLFETLLYEEAELADKRAVNEGHAAQERFESRVSGRIQPWARTVLKAAGSGNPDALPLGLPKIGVDSSVINATALRRFSDILGLGDSQSINLTLPFIDPSREFIAKTSQLSSRFPVEVLGGVVRSIEHPRSRSLQEHAVFVRPLNPTAPRQRRG